MSARRELDRAFASLGYEYQGVNGNGHWVWTHPNGATMRAGKDLSGRKLINYRNIAKRNVGYADAKSQRFIRFVLDSFNVGERDQREVEFQMGTMTAAFKALNPDAERWSVKAPQMALRHSPLVAYLGGGKGGTKSRFRLTGKLYDVHADEGEAADAVVRDGDERDAVDRVVPVDHPAGADAPEDGAGGSSESAELGDDPVVDEPDRPVVVDDIPKVPGLFVPEPLAKALRDALGAGDDVEAENALLRETLTTVLGSLHAASEAVEAALSLHDAEIRKPVKGVGYNLGAKRTRQLHALQAADLPDRITKEDVADALGIDPKDGSNVLWTISAAGYLRRLAPGVYQWVKP